jgi:hypothetical protein
MDKCEQCGARVEHALLCDACCRELFGTGNCSECGAPDAPFVGGLEGDEYFCDDCAREYLSLTYVKVAEPGPPTKH